MIAQPLLYLEEFSPGQTFVSASVTLDADAIKAYARQFDPQPFHPDEEAAAGAFFKGLAASGWHTVSMTMRLLVGGLPIAGGIIGVGVDEIRWPRPTRPGDALRLVTAGGAPVEIAPGSRADKGAHHDLQPEGRAGAGDGVEPRGAAPPGMSIGRNRRLSRPAIGDMRCWCRRFEVPTPLAASSTRNFKSKSGTRIIEILVPLCFRSSYQNVQQRITNFGNGALGA